MFCELCLVPLCVFVCVGNGIRVMEWVQGFWVILEWKQDGSDVDNRKSHRNVSAVFCTKKHSPTHHRPTVPCIDINLSFTIALPHLQPNVTLRGYSRKTHSRLCSCRALDLITKYLFCRKMREEGRQRDTLYPPRRQIKFE